MAYKLSLPDFTFSLTEGTGIPPPPPQKDPARPPTPGRGPLSSHPTTPVNIPGAFPFPTDSAAEQTQLHRPAKKLRDSEEMAREHALQDLTTSPSSSVGSRGPPPFKRPASVRRFLSLRSLNIISSSQAGSPSAPGVDGRPGSPWSTTSTSSKTSFLRRKTAWFSSARRRSSRLWGLSEAMENPLDHKENGYARTSMGPPPPTLPELDTLQNGNFNLDGGSLDADGMFKDIR